MLSGFVMYNKIDLFLYFQDLSDTTEIENEADPSVLESSSSVNRVTQECINLENDPTDSEISVSLEQQHPTAALDDNESEHAQGAKKNSFFGNVISVVNKHFRRFAWKSNCERA